MCHAKSETQALDALRDVSLKSFDVSAADLVSKSLTDRPNNKMNPLMFSAQAGQLTHQFSIPRIYAVGDSDNNGSEDD